MAPSPIEAGDSIKFSGHGRFHQQLGFLHWVGSSNVTNMNDEVRQAIIEEYKEWLMFPTKPYTQKEIKDPFSSNRMYLFPWVHLMHIAKRCPRGGGSQYFNFNSFHCIVLLALVDANYQFLCVDVGSSRSWCDSQIFNRYDLRDMTEDRFSLPQPIILNT